MRKTYALMQVATELLADSAGKQHYGYDLAKKSGVRSGVLYPMLARMVEAGWLTDGWEDPVTIQGRPPRRYYELTEEGILRLGGLIEEARADARFASLRERWV
jgi:PadR family transcriptional regulator PadR